MADRGWVHNGCVTLFSALESTLYILFSGAQIGIGKGAYLTLETRGIEEGYYWV